MTQPIRAVIFDVAQVIVQWDPRLPLQGELDKEAVDAFAHHHRFWALNAEADAGLRIADMRVRIDAEMPEVRTAFDTYVRNFARCVPGPMPGTTEVIGELQAAGLPVVSDAWWAVASDDLRPQGESLRVWWRL